LLKHVRLTAAVLVAALLVVPSVAFTDQTFSIKGKVIDAATGLALVGVNLQTVGPTQKNAITDSLGTFSFSDLAAGTYSLQASLSGYETTLSEEFAIGPGFSLPLTLAMQRGRGAGAKRVLATTTITASRSLQKATVVYEQVSGNTLQRQGIARAGDAIRAMGGVDNTRSDTASFGDDVQLAIRGIGDLETVSLIDGHPVALGLASGLNYEVSPSFGLRAVSVVYGAGGGDLYGVDAIGGVVDMQTLEPTRIPSATLTQGWGTFSKLTSALQATGTLGNEHWGYAIALGTQGMNGPIRNTVVPQPAAAFDISATDPTVVAAGLYPIDSNLTNKSQLYKLRYNFGSNTSITAAALSSFYWDNKSGNGDNDFLPMDTALAVGANKLASYTPPGNAPPFNALNPPDCPAGTFLGTGTGGNAYGYGLDGVTPDGGTTCVTPQQWANLNSGYQGAGPAWQSFLNTDYQLRLNSTMGRNILNVVGYSDYYHTTYDRTSQLPFILIPPTGSSSCNPSCTLEPRLAFWHNDAVNNAGAIATFALVGNNNEFAFGAYYNNITSKFNTSMNFPDGTCCFSGNLPDPSAHETSFFFRDTYHPLSSPLTTYLSAYFKHSSLTNTSVIDPRIAFVNDQGNDVYRIAFGQVSTQPALAQVFSPFSASPPGSLLGAVKCNTLNSIGNGGNPHAKPERASDSEFSWGHRFSGDSSIQLSLYTEPIIAQLYTQTIPVSQFPASFFGTTDLNAYANFVTAACGGTNASNLQFLGVDGVVNIGSGIAEGIELTGRQRFGRQFYIDYGYATNSSYPLNVPVNILANNLSTIPGSQYPHIPLQKVNFALDFSFSKSVELRTETYFVAKNNPKNLPAYNYTNLVLSYFTGDRGVFTTTVNNLFQQNAFYQGLIGEGYPLPLNQQFASSIDPRPLLGTAATERFGMPFRTVEFIYSYKVH
jgi:hypothetical protein